MSDIGQGLPVFHTDGEPMGDLDLPAPARAAQSALGWLAQQARKVSGG
jgi:hypothetical protein